ncbi:hypothetical protein FNV43_RR06889 [Rhamnella rubrinervis]|uniref:Acyl-[acyl-carrier-protein] hydrolase n=1 Tax=Rhamnella rubrinervis TaxID=2594499 RepID=A0A8K0MME7_9ROSA|nr:hypothetical protein FNV43_RR06889 [Rhamnella rubrinervis]
MVEDFSSLRSFMMVLPYSPSIKERAIRCGNRSFNTNGNKPNFASATRLQLNMNVAESSKIKASLERLENSKWKPKQLDKIVEIFGGRLLERGLVFQQNFLIRSSELGPDGKASIWDLISILQESALNHFKSAGILAEGFGSTPEMRRRNLIWVVYKMQIVVDSYPSWADVIQVDTWTCASGRNGMCREWVVRDYKTGKILLRAVCVYVMMNKRTRKISRFIEETREEIRGIFMEITHPIVDNEDERKLRELDVDTADNVQTGILPKWSDLDANQHVNHVKYIEWILESAPRSILETHKLSTMTLEFRKECGMNTSLQSLSAVSCRDDPPDKHPTNNEGFELEHTIRVENDSHILLKGRTIYQPNFSSGRNYSSFAPAASRFEFNVNVGGPSNNEKGTEKFVDENEYDGGRLMQDGLIFRQNFRIRLSELGPDYTASMWSLLGILQETAVNHCKSTGIPIDRLCTTPETRRRNVMWVVYRMKIVADSYPSWADVIETDTRICESGRNGMRREWIVREYDTGKTLLRAVCVYVLMNKRTRKLSKFIEEVREEMKGIFMDITDPILVDDDDDEGGRELRELDVDTAHNIRTGLLSAPRWILETHKLSAMNLEFRKECGLESVVQSLSAISKYGPNQADQYSTQTDQNIELEHTIRLENESNILLKGRTIWIPKKCLQPN